MCQTKRQFGGMSTSTKLVLQASTEIPITRGEKKAGPPKTIIDALQMQVITLEQNPIGISVGLGLGFGTHPSTR